MRDSEDPVRVLHVDDDADFAALVARFLEREDECLSVVTEPDAAAGLDRLGDTDVDCIVSDYDMPGRNGIEFLEAVRERDPDVPFVLFTGKGSEEIASEAISAGVTDYLQKETGTDQYAILANRIRNAVDRTRAERERRRHLDAIETAREGISILDDDGRFTYVNQAYADLYGYEPDELIGEHWDLLYVEDDVDAARDDILPAVEADGYWHGTTTGLRADGTTFVEDHALAATANGKLVCTVRDVTENAQRKRAIEKLHSTAQIFMTAETEADVGEVAVEAVRDILDMRANAVHIYDEETGRLMPVAWSETANELTGGESMPALDPDDSIAGEVFESGEPRVYDDVSTAPGRAADSTRVRSEIILPLGDRGVLIIGTCEVGAFDETDVSLARIVAVHATTALDSIERARELREERAFIDQALDTIDDLYYVVGTDGGMERWNDTFRCISEYDDETIATMNVAEFFPPDERDRIREAFEEAVATGETTVEAEIRTGDGDRVPYEFTGSLLTDADGEPARVVGTGRDVSARKERERRLKENRAFATDLLTCETPEAVCDRTVRAAESLLEFDAAAVYLAEDNGLSQVAGSGTVGSDGVDAAHAGVEAAREAHGTGESVRAVADDSESAVGSALAVPVDGRGALALVSERPDGFGATDLELAELLVSQTEKALGRLDRERELRRKNDRLDEFASILSHDLRNPLNVAQGRLAMAREECDSDHLDEVEGAHERIEELIGDLLAIAQAGESAVEMDAVALDAAVEECWGNVATRDATVVVEAERSIRADESHLGQLLENLFRNAVEHGGQGVTITVGELPGDAGFYVEDDGRGLPGEESSQIFETGYSTADEGTGFGMSIVEQVASAHGWRVNATEGDDGGARFEILGVEFVAE
ncbi:hybrid sensor histidine kinase/response regulator [Halorussus marinus]|uniref:hybrid sensor histidine kinase/response regulator n=1 Tax=Halorussus marinus TaxID=2505976 RepID=UPI00106ECC5B|nr:PAS domain S-box protein [Halorussus marinus]